MISAKFGHFLDKPLSPVVRHLKIHPNIFTIAGFLITLLAAIVLTINLRIGGILIILGGLFDMIDGVVARANGLTSRFGAFLDSVLDRYSDAAIFIGLAWYLLKTDNIVGAIICIFTMIGALLISYTKARAEGIGEKCHVGIIERPERIILISFACFTGWIMPVLWVMLIFTHITVLQRIFHTWKATQLKGN